MESLGARAPAGAVVLFAGKGLGSWAGQGGKPAPWKVEAGFLEIVPGTGNIQTRQHFRDFYLHLEFRCPYKPNAKGQERGNSGVYLQGRYEMQILDSHGVASPGPEDCGAIYGLAAPLVNAARPAMAWQTLEAIFRAPRDAQPARVTAFLNGTVIHNNLSLDRTTPGALDDTFAPEGPIVLQDHGDLVAFRRIWVLELPEGA